MASERRRPPKRERCIEAEDGETSSQRTRSTVLCLSAIHALLPDAAIFDVFGEQPGHRRHCCSSDCELFIPFPADEATIRIIHLWASGLITTSEFVKRGGTRACNVADFLGVQRKGAHVRHSLLQFMTVSPPATAPTLHGVRCLADCFVGSGVPAEAFLARSPPR